MANFICYQGVNYKWPGGFKAGDSVIYKYEDEFVSEPAHVVAMPIAMVPSGKVPIHDVVTEDCQSRTSDGTKVFYVKFVSPEEIMRSHRGFNPTITHH